MKLTNKNAADSLLGLAAAFGVVGALRISAAHVLTDFSCPVLLFVPACFLVLAGYGLIMASVFTERFRPSWPGWLFWTGWLIVFGFALTGASIEIFGSQACPQGYAGVPACYYSFGLATICLVLHLVRRRV